MAKKLIIFIPVFLCFFVINSNGQSCTGSFGDPIVNITFGQGTNPGGTLSAVVPGASTSYVYVAPGGNPPANIVLDGDYSIINGIPSNPGWLSGGDHTNNGNGYMAFFNAAPNPGDFYHQTISGLCPGTTYEFAAWILNAINVNVISNAVPPNVTFKIFDPANLAVPLVSFSTGDIPASDVETWYKYSTLFTTPAGLNSVLLTLSNNNVGGTSNIGNDLAIDDITFRACGPLTTASFSPTGPVTSYTVCNNIPYTLYGNISSGLNNPVYQWQVSSDNGASWINIPGGTTLNYIVAGGSVAGTYLFRLISQENSNISSPFCKFYSNIIQLNVTPLTINAGTDTSFCSNSSVTHVLHGNSTGTNYSWTPAVFLNNNTLQNPTATVSSTTTFYLTSSNASGCSAIDSVKIIVNPLPVVSTINNTSICKRDSLLLTTVGGATTFQWTPAISVTNANIQSPYFIDTVTHQMFVTATNTATGCFAKDSVTITIKPLPIIKSIADTSICGAQNIVLNTTGGQTYSWSPSTNINNPNIANPVFNGNNPQIYTYYVTGTGVNSCKSKDTVNITLNPKPVVNTINNATICRGDTLQLLTNTNAQMNHWLPSASVNNPNIANPYFTDSVTQMMTVTGTNTTGCFATDVVTITVKPRPIIKTRADTAFCGPGVVTLNTTGGQSYSWSPVTNLNNPAISNPVFNGTNTQVYTYYVSGIGANGCSAKDTVKITINAVPLVNTINNTSICRGDSLQLVTNSNAQTNHWTPPLSVNNPNIANPYFTDTISQQLTLTGTNTSTGCFSSDVVTITVKPKPTVTTINDFTSCSTNTVTLFTTGAQTYSWSPVSGLNNPNIANPVFTGQGTYTYYVTGTGANGCIAKDTVKIIIADKPVFIAPVNKTICAHESVMLDGNNGTTFQYLWSPGSYLSNTNIINPLANPLITTDYSLTIKDAVCNYDSSFTVRVTVNPLPNISATKSNDLDCANPESQLGATGALQYSWTPSSGLNNSSISNPVASPSSTTEYVVFGTDNNGCKNKDTVTVFVKGGQYFGFNIPNSFTPNGDGLNDCFGVSWWGETNNFKLSVYNRWGAKVFETQQVSDCWDGTYKGQPADVGNYVFYLSGETLCGKVFKKGNILLIR